MSQRTSKWFKTIEKVLCGLFFCKICCPYLDIRGPCSGKRIGVCGALQCVWKIRCGAHPCRGTGLLLMAAEDVWQKGGGYHPWR